MSTDVAKTNENTEELVPLLDLIEDEKGGLIAFQDIVKTKQKLTELANQHRGMEVTKENLVDAKKARMELRTTRTSLDKIEKNNTRFYNSKKDDGKAVIAELIEITEGVENEIDEKIKAIEKADQIAKEEKARLENERIQNIETMLTQYRANLADVYTKAKLEEVDISEMVKMLEELQEAYPKFEERLFDAEKIYFEYESRLPELRSYLEKRKKEAEELAKLRAQQEEDRKAKEAEEKRQAEDRKKLEEEKAAFEKEKAEAREKEAKVEFDRRKNEIRELGFKDNPEQKRLESPFINLQYIGIKTLHAESFFELLEDIKDKKFQYENKLRKEEADRLEAEKEAKLIEDRFEEREKELAAMGFGLNNGWFVHQSGVQIKDSDIKNVLPEFWKDTVNELNEEIRKIDHEKALAEKADKAKQEEIKKMKADAKAVTDFMTTCLNQVVSETPKLKNKKVKERVDQFYAKMIEDLNNLKKEFQLND